MQMHQVFSGLLPPHLPQKQQHGGEKGHGAVGQNPEQMGPDIAVIAREHRPLHLHRVNKRQGIIGQKLEFHKVGEFRSRYFEVFC